MVAALLVGCTEAKKPNSNMKPEQRAKICQQLKTRMSFQAPQAPMKAPKGASGGKASVQLQSEWYADTEQEKAQLRQQYKYYGCDEIITIDKQADK